MPQFQKLSIEGLILITPDRFGDERGFFSETYNEKIWQENGVRDHFMQDNQSFSAQKGTLRGLHFQTPPFGQAKLVRVTRGSVFDVAVDIRANSPTFGQWEGVILSANEGNQFYIPQGFAHGFLTLEDNCEFLYKVSNPYSKPHDRAIRFDDPTFKIEWPLKDVDFILSEKDQAAPFIKDIDTEFKL